MAQDLFEVYGVKAPEEQPTPEEQQPDAQAEEAEKGVQDTAEQTGQSREENSKYAKARRKAEAERDRCLILNLVRVATLHTGRICFTADALVVGVQHSSVLMQAVILWSKRGD